MTAFGLRETFYIGCAELKTPWANAKFGCGAKRTNPSFDRLRVIGLASRRQWPAINHLQLYVNR